MGWKDRRSARTSLFPSPSVRTTEFGRLGNGLRDACLCHFSQFPADLPLCRSDGQIRVDLLSSVCSLLSYEEFD